MERSPAHRDPAPDVSVILAVSDGWESTLEALLALAEASRGARCELIVVDDASGDETAAMLPALQGVRWHRNPTPQGLVEARNQGAAMARAPWLVFLDREARPAPGWLAALEDPGAAPATGTSCAGALAVRADAFRAACGFEGPDPVHAREGLLRRLLRPRLTTAAPIPLFSIIVPACEQAAFLPQALDSLLAQTLDRWEAVVVDVGEREAAPSVLEAYAEGDRRFRLLRRPGAGLAAALNAGLREARGAWVCWLSQGTLFLPEKLALHLEAIRRHPEARFFHGGHLLLDGPPERLAEPTPPPVTQVPPPELQVLGLLGRNYVHGASVAVHQAALEAVGPLDERAALAPDHELWLRLSSRFTSRWLDPPTCLLRVHPFAGCSTLRTVGLLDSGRAALAFLDAHPLEALFPLLDLRRLELARRALGAVFRIAADPTACLTASGHAQALLSRLAEWITVRCPARLRDELARLHDDLVHDLWQSDLPVWVKEPFVSLAGWPVAHLHRPGDPAASMAAHAATVRRAGDPGFAAAIEGYLARPRLAAAVSPAP